MTPKQALAKANQLWGKGKEVYSAGGHVVKRKPYSKIEGHVKAEFMYDVGFVSNLFIPMYHVKGTGTSWEAAFEDAEQKRLRDKAQMDEIRAKRAQQVSA